MDIVVLSPSLPPIFEPQLQTVPSFLSATTWKELHETFSQSFPPEIVWTGDDLFVVVPSPNCPKSFLPHNQRLPSCFIPAETSPEIAFEILIQSFPPAIVWTGELFKTVSFVPNCPNSLSPQTHKELSDFKAKTWFWPTETSIQSFPADIVWTKELRFVVSLVPNCPNAL